VEYTGQTAEELRVVHDDLEVFIREWYEMRDDKFLAKVKSRVSPHIVFVGEFEESPGIYIHRNLNGDIDSLILEHRCLHPGNGAPFDPVYEKPTVTKIDEPKKGPDNSRVKSIAPDDASDFEPDLDYD
jgi:hypothetical protein